MSDQHHNQAEQLVSKCVAIQYGILIAGIIIVLVMLFNWYQEYSTSCLSSCKVNYMQCKGKCTDTKERYGIRKDTTERFGQADAVNAWKAAEAKINTYVDSHTGPVGEVGLHEFLTNNTAAPSSVDAAGNDVHADGEVVPAWDPAAYSLENSVYNSHKEFTDDSYISTQGPSSANMVRDDAVDINPRVGLRKIDYSSIIPADDARVVPSEYPDQLASLSIGTYVL